MNVRPVLAVLAAAAALTLGLAVPASADPADFNVSQFCTDNNDFPQSFSSHGECVNAWHKDDNTFFAIICKDPINQEFSGTDNQGQCMKFFRALLTT